MDGPNHISFTDLDVDVRDLFHNITQGPMNLSWTRVQFTIPDNYEAPKKVEAWLSTNTPGQWATYHYTSPRGKDRDFQMVVRFEDRNDALMFKLRGGHQSWE